MKAIEKVTEALSAARENGNDQVVRLLTEFLMANQPSVGKGKVDIWKFTDPKEIREYCRGVLYNLDEKVAVATDRFSLIISKPDFKECEPNEKVRASHKEGRFAFYNKKGESLEVIYPWYESVIPQDGVPAQMNDRDAIAEALKTYKVRKKEMKYVNAVIEVCPGMYFSADRVETLLHMPDWSKWFFTKVDRALKYKDDDYTAIFMPFSRAPKGKERIGLLTIL